MLKWGYTDGSSDLECGEGTQTMLHLLSCDRMHPPCSERDLAMANGVALTCARHWDTVV